MPEPYKQALSNYAATKEGRKALSRYRKFWGVPYPVELDDYEIPGPNKTVRMVGLGTTPHAYISGKPQGKGGRARRIKGPFLVVADANGKQVMLLRKRKSKQRRGNRRKKKFLGWVPQTDYVPSAALEKAGTFKRGKYWVHKHDDEGGTWPKAWQDQQGNIIYGPSTLRVDKWMRR